MVRMGMTGGDEDVVVNESPFTKGPPGPFGHGFAPDSHGLAPRR